MKILISAALYTPHISGLTNSIKNVAELLATNGDSVTVITSQHNKKLQRKEVLNGVSINRVPYLFRLNKGFIMPLFLWEAYKEVRKTDQILINLPQFEGFIVALFGKLFHKKVHAIYVCDVTTQGGLLNKLIINALQWSNSFTIDLSADVVTLTKDYKESSPFLRKIKKEFTIIPPVIIEPQVSLSAKKNMQLKLPKKGIHLIGFVGRVSSEKGIEYVFEAIPRIKKMLDKPFVIVIAGPEQVIGEKSYQRKIQKYMEEYKENILNIGQLTDSELGAFYSSLDVLVLPSTNATEVFGMVQVESMLCGTPVVASNLAGVRTVVQQTGMGETAKIKNAKDFADKLVQVIRYRKSYIKSVKDIREVYSTERVLSLYKSLLK